MIYEANLVQYNGAADKLDPLPDFIELESSQSSIITVKKTTRENIGTYDIYLRAILSDLDATEAVTTVNIQVIDPCTNAIVNAD